MKVLLIDNYDSFTHNLKALLEAAGALVRVTRNDKVGIEQIAEADAIVFSPGPGIPGEAGQLVELIKEYHPSKPMLGVCLGMQAIGEVFGAELRLLKAPIHGFSSKIEQYGDEIFTDVPSHFEAARYHSWVIDKEKIRYPLTVIARSEDDEIMAIRHLELPVYGFQFHPESILTSTGKQLMTNFLNAVKKYNYAKATR